jgi:hypothetical protein
LGSALTILLWRIAAIDVIFPNQYPFWLLRTKIAPPGCDGNVIVWNLASKA